MRFRVILFFLVILTPSQLGGKMYHGEHHNILSKGQKADANMGLLYRIVLGRSATAEEFPFIAEIVGTKGHLCGGVIVHERFVVTAGHCVQPFLTAKSFPIEFLKIIVGNDQQKIGGVTHQIKKIIPPTEESYAEGYLRDIALIQLVKPIIFNNRMQPIAISRKTPSPGETGWVIGFGEIRIKKFRSAMSNNRHLMAVNIPVVPFEYCRKVYMSLYHDVICAGDNTPRDACQGDSGGPFIINNMLVGVVSRGKGCGNPGIPGMYTNVALYERWIRFTIQYELLQSREYREPM